MVDEPGTTRFVHAGEAVETREAWEAREAMRLARQANEKRQAEAREAAAREASAREAAAREAAAREAAQRDAAVQTQRNEQTPSGPGPKVANGGSETELLDHPGSHSANGGVIAAVVAAIVVLAGLVALGVRASRDGSGAYEDVTQAASQLDETKAELSRLETRAAEAEARAKKLEDEAAASKAAEQDATERESQRLAAESSERQRRDTMAYVVEQFGLIESPITTPSPQFMLQLSSDSSLIDAKEANDQLVAGLARSPTWREMKTKILADKKGRFFTNVILWPANSRAPAETDLGYAKSFLNQGGFIRKTQDYCPCWQQGTVVGLDDQPISLAKCEFGRKETRNRGFFGTETVTVCD